MISSPSTAPTTTRRATRVVLLLCLVLALVLLLSATTADAAAHRRDRKSKGSTTAPSTDTAASAGPPRRLSLKQRQAEAKRRAEQAAADEQYFEQRYKEYQKALPNPEDGKRMIPYSATDAAAEENPHALATTGAIRTEAEVSHIRSLSVGKLRSYLKEREASCPGCVEKLHLIERAMQVRGWETETERVGKELTAAQLSAENALSLQHISTIPATVMASGSTAQPLTDAHGNQLVPTTHSKEQLAAVQLSHGISCAKALNNGTQYCHQVLADDSPAHFM